MRSAVMGVAAVGVVLLVWTASPIWWNGLVESGAEGPVSGMVFVALVFGTAAGVLAGLLGRLRVRAGHESTGPGAVIAFITASLVALLPIGFFVTRFSASDHQRLPSSRVFEACVAWLVYVAFAYVLFGIVSGRATRRARTGAPSPGKR
jgi:hypothetical protein